jgi:hypothetical protein
MLHNEEILETKKVHAQHLQAQGKKTVKAMKGPLDEDGVMKVGVLVN